MSSLSISKEFVSLNIVWSRGSLFWSHSNTVATSLWHPLFLHKLVNTLSYSLSIGKFPNTWPS